MRKIGTIDSAVGKRCFIYWNLHKKCFSIKALDGENKGRVIAHADKVHVESCQFKVSQAGRRRVLRDKCKNVHAGIVGVVRDAAPDAAPDLVGITYNPYIYDSFVQADRPSVPIERASYASLNKNERPIVAASVI
jgi:hypothetical protein